MKRIDERDTIFSRLSLQEGTKDYGEYYAQHSGMKDADDEVRRERLLGRGKKLEMDPEDRVLHNIAAGTGNLIRQFHETAAATKPADKKVTMPLETMSRLLVEAAVYYGAAAAGTIELSEDDFYSRHGGSKSTLYGKPVDTRWKWAIVFTLEMDRSMINRAPHDEEELTVMRAYLMGAFVGCQIVLYLKSLGYDAYLNSLQQYDAPLKPLAMKAGLGQSGRSNLLVTKKHGCRVRLGAVMTDMALAGSEPVDFGLTEFCKRCGKCAENCPTGAIEKGQPSISNEHADWTFSDTRCMTMWNRAGTDCGICISSCPFTQGVDPALVERMKDDPDVMDRIIREDRERYGKRAYIEGKLPIRRLGDSPD